MPMGQVQYVGSCQSVTGTRLGGWAQWFWSKFEPAEASPVGAGGGHNLKLRL